MKKILPFLAIAILLSACDPYQFDEATVIRLKKDPCFGVCPVYSFTVNGKGNATFDGTRNVSKVGPWKRQLTPEATNELFKAFEASNFGQFQDEYTAQVTDLPTTWVTYKTTTTEKTIKDYYGAPEALKNLEKLVETIAEEDTDWVQ
jgi:Domain of unknown function (DUF6438)